MENVNWIVTLVVGALFSIPIGIFVNIMTPSARNWMSKYSLIIRENNVAKLQQELNALEFYRQNKGLIYIPILYNILSSSVWLFIGAILLIVGFTFIIYPDPFVGETGGVLEIKSIGVFLNLFGLFIFMGAGIYYSIVLVNEIVNKYLNIDSYIVSLQSRIGELRNQQQ